jgi:hypothetical protein
VLILVVHIQLRGFWACKHDGGNVYDCASVVIGLTSTIAIVNAAVEPIHIHKTVLILCLLVQYLCLLCAHLLTTQKAVPDLCQAQK